ILGLKKVVLLGLKVTCGILVKGVEEGRVRFCMIGEKDMEKRMGEKKCMEVEKMKGMLKYGS
ncbi:hypothetical protein, partial [Staphylococcus aureus]|uniref:hypothetical protein n=1 Tax=Staphylococcus aureus TaxID=1280 RepID=UPI001C92C869